LGEVEVKLVRFDILNFKGIDKTSINLSDEIPGNVVTLIGLNESGKTTILEALSHFITEDKETANLVGTVHKKSGIQELIPKDKKAAFTGRISIKAIVELEDGDKRSLSNFFAENHNLTMVLDQFQAKITLERAYTFEDSSLKDTHTYWSVIFPLKTGKGKKYTNYVSSGDTRTVWLSGVDHIRAMVPRVVFFPTFLFNFPDRIYLEEQTETEINAYYKQVIQDVLDSQGEHLSVQKHIVDRIKKQRDAFPTPALFISHLLGLDEKSQIDAVMQKISNEMSRIIFGAWSEILGRSVSNKRVQVDWFVDGERKNSPYLQVSIIDGQSRYSLSERSLGFRWFFSFLLFTQFRRKRSAGSETVFLFDEPAANLHSKAQTKLLESFSKIASGGTYIIYSTHSHYMVNPLWLEKAYIVDNKAVDYDDDDEVNSFQVRKTDIEAIKYRSFVARNSTKTTYFQPVLDALDVGFSPLERSARALILEGKFDYHPFIYFRSLVSTRKEPEIFPAAGAGGIGHIINLFRGWDVSFLILLDDDQGGKEARKKYIKDYLLPEDQVMTLGQISNDLSDRAFESIYQLDVVNAIRTYFGVEEVTKRHFSLFFQELIANKSVMRFPETEILFGKISSWVDAQFPSME
jgi:ABC-type Mn2+/Zn2+ transport system ATPase subunit